MKKKIVSAVLSAMVFSFALTGCSGGETGTGVQIDPLTGLPTGTVSQSASQQNGGTQQSPAGSTVTPTTQPGTISPVNTNVNVRTGEWNNIEWENYNNGYFTLLIPKGWQVEAGAELDYVTYRVYNPTNEFIGVTFRDRMEVYKDQNMAAQYGIGLYDTTGTTQEFFERFYSGTVNSFTVQNASVPSDYTAMQYGLGSRTINDYRSLYATFSQSGVEGEGIYSALVISTPDVYSGGMNYGMWSLVNIVAQYAPVGQLKNWMPVYSQIIKSFAYTTEYVTAWQQANGTSTSSLSSGISDTDPVVQAFNERSEQDTIIQEKRSDMIGEYERVYDNDTGNIYRAYNGFYDDIGGSNQTKYTPITDSQYTQGYVGWIDK